MTWERGINRTARKDTAGLLAGALGLTGSTRDLFIFIAVALGRGPAEEVLAARTGRVPAASHQNPRRERGPVAAAATALSRPCSQIAATVGIRPVLWL